MKPHEEMDLTRRIAFLQRVLADTQAELKRRYDAEPLAAALRPFIDVAKRMDPKDREDNVDVSRRLRDPVDTHELYAFDSLTIGDWLRLLEVCAPAAVTVNKGDQR
jgi:hypothetical protein